MVVPSTVSVSTESTVTGGKSTASDIRHVLSATRGAATGSHGEYCVAEDGKVYVSMNTLRQYRTNIGRVSKTTTGSLMDNGANGGMAGDDVLITAYHDHDRDGYCGK